jgi:hypothetical protein
LNKNIAGDDVKSINTEVLPADIHNERDLLDSMSYTTEDVRDVKESDIILNEN